MVYFEGGTRRIIDGNDYYWFYNGEFYQSDKAPLDVDAELIKLGTQIADKDFETIQREALAAQ